MEIAKNWKKKCILNNCQIIVFQKSILTSYSIVNTSYKYTVMLFMIVIFKIDQYCL